MERVKWKILKVGENVRQTTEKSRNVNHKSMTSITFMGIFIIISSAVLIKSSHGAWTFKKCVLVLSSYKLKCGNEYLDY